MARIKREIFEIGRTVYNMDVYTISTKRTNVHGECVDMEQCQSEKNGKTRRQYSSIWAKQLKELRERNNLSQADVAKVLHCSQVAYGMYELGKRKLPIERLITLAKFYHVSLDSLTGLSRE